MRRSTLAFGILSAVLGAGMWLAWPATGQPGPTGTRMMFFDGSATDIAAAGLTTIDITNGQDGYGILSSGKASLMNVEVCNVGTNALDDFAVQLLDHPSATWYTFLQDTDFDIATDDMLWCSSTGPQEIDSNGCAHFQVRIRAAWAARLQASAESGDGTYAEVQVYGSIMPE